MGNKQSGESTPSPAGSSNGSHPPAPPQKKEFVADNAFRKTDDEHFARITKDKGKMSKALTFDDRKLLTNVARQAPAGTQRDIEGPRLKRAVTFVGKTKIQRRNSFSLSDVVYRRHFGEQEEKGGRARGISYATEYQGILESTTRSRATSSAVSAPAERRKEAFVVVDCFSTGAMVAYRGFLMGYHIINVSSADLGSLVDMVPEGLDFHFSANFSLDVTLEEEAGIEKLIGELNASGWKIKAVVAGAETGVELADELSSRMGLRTNGTAQSSARRNKYIMGETVRGAGIRAVRQLEVKTWAQVQEFVDGWQPDPFKVIAKPMDSAGSEDVTLCRNIEELQAAFGKILGKKNGLGLINQSVLIQEYLEGTEYIVDFVSRDGEHKLTGLWEYDRRPANGASFVCHGQRMLVVDDDPDKYGQIIEYQKKVITALGIVNGPSHGEVKWFKGEPVLVEVGSRCHGGDGLWVNVAEEAVGVSQVQSTVDVFLGEPEVFEKTAPLTSRLGFCGEKWLVSYQAGILKQINPEAVDEIKAMSSYRGHQFFVKAGGEIKKTQNCFSWAGCVMIANADKEQMEKDYKRIEELQMKGLFDVAELEVKDREFVGIVDPFSTGANLAAEMYKRGYSIIAVYSGDMEKLGNLQSLVPAGLALEFAAICPFKESVEDMAKDLSAHGKVVAVVAGAETGVELADQLSFHMKLRTNGIDNSVARRNKYIMGETVRKAGVRAVKQLQAQDWDSVAAFVAEWNPNPFRAIVKPMDSAGSEDVTKCMSVEEVETAFKRILGKKNGLGLINHSVLVQEFLEGTEYVVDMVSRNGEHKVVALWEYDKRPINGAPFVMFGQSLKLVPDDDDRFSRIIAYQKKVVTALGIKNGPSHGEVKWVQGEPVLVEVSAAADAWLSQEDFDKLPDQPMIRHGDGRLAFFICQNEKPGVLNEISATAVEEIRGMKSFHHMEIFLKPGQIVHPTINCFTFGGVVVLLNPNTEELLVDYARVHELEKTMFMLV